jgi:hypothetical protein
VGVSDPPAAAKIRELRPAGDDVVPRPAERSNEVAHDHPLVFQVVVGHEHRPGHAAERVTVLGQAAISLLLRQPRTGVRMLGEQLVPPLFRLDELVGGHDRSVSGRPFARGLD